ncbi:MAG: outer membrane lipoprotein chaperone LolA [Desulfovibrio sp.]
MRYISKAFVALMLVVLCTAPAMANELTDRIQARYESIKTFSADFTQSLTSAQTGEASKRSGKILFKQPGLIRWDTAKPEKELLIVGPDSVWNYFAEEELAVKYGKDQIFDSKNMVKFISGQANLAADFYIEEQGVEDGLLKIKLIPQEPEANMVLAFIWVNEATGQLFKYLIVDFYGNGNEVALSSVKENIIIDDKEFTFTPPEGVDVEDNTQ